jgi:hypothetical protein
MTAYYPFVPSNVRAPSFTPMLDGENYTITILWNVSAQRYYVKCTSFNNNLIFMVPLVDTLIGMEIQSLIWDENNKVVIAKLAAPHNFPIGEIVNVSIIQTLPTTYNGSGMALIVGHNTFTYPVAQDPGAMYQAGVVQYLISMSKSYFNSTLIFRNRQFEVSP